MNIMTSFLIGQLMLLVALYGGWRLANHRPDLAGRMEKIRHYVSKRRRTEKLQAELKRANEEHALVSRKLQRTRLDVADRVDGADSHALAHVAVRYAILAFAMFEGDAVLFLWLSGHSDMFGLNELAWAPFASWAAFVILVLFHSVLESAVGNRHTPRLTRKRARIGVWLAGGIVGMSLWATLSGRGVDFVGADWAATVIAMGFWSLTLAMALTAASATVVVQSALDESRPDERLVSLETLDQAFTRHIAAVTTELTELTAPPSGEQSSGMPQGQGGLAGGGMRRSVGPSAAALLLIGLMLAKGAPAMAEPSQGPATAAVTSQSQSNGAGVNLPRRLAPRWVFEGTPDKGSCEELADMSGSVGSGNKQQLANAGAALLPYFINDYACTLVRISSFSGDAPFQPIQEFAIPAITGSQPCPDPVKKANGSLIGSIYPAYANKDRQDGNERCRQTQLARNELEKRSRSEAIMRASDSMKSLGATVAHGTCTAIYQAAARALLRSRFVVIVTDGQNDCGWYRDTDGTALKIPVNAQNLLLFLLVPPADERNMPSEPTLERGAEAQETFPGATVRLLNEAAGPSFWRDLRNPKPAN